MAGLEQHRNAPAVETFARRRQKFGPVPDGTAGEQLRLGNVGGDPPGVRQVRRNLPIRVEEEA